MTPSGPGVLVVLHGTEPTASPALSSLLSVLRPGEVAALVVQDNTEGCTSPPPVPDAVTAYVPRPDNPGLAVAYAETARRLRSDGVAWMVLLDQDTVVDRAYLDEVLEITSGRRPVPPDVGVLLPRLLDRGRVLSPHRRVRLRTRAVEDPRPGPATGWVSHLNSGSVLRLEALEAAGGVPEGYPLDGLDHAIAATLRRAGLRSWLMRSTLEHRLSLLDRPTLSADRLAAVLAAEGRYAAQLGSRGDRAWLAVRRWLGLVLVVARVRSTPSTALELRAAREATALALARSPRGRR